MLCMKLPVITMTAYYFNLHTIPCHNSYSYDITSSSFWLVSPFFLEMEIGIIANSLQQVIHGGFLCWD
jgi:hypothetical protein